MNIRSIVLTSLFAALIATGAYLAIPMAPVPITLQTFFIIAAGLIGGRKIGMSAVGIYLIAGAIGLPVFSGGSGGVAHLVGPTGGFIFGALLSTFIAGIFSDLARRIPDESTDETTKTSATLLLIIGGVLAALAIYLIGLPWLKVTLEFTWAKTFTVGMIPFLIGDTIKTVAAITLARLFLKRVASFLNKES